MKLTVFTKADISLVAKSLQILVILRVGYKVLKSLSNELDGDFTDGNLNFVLNEVQGTLLVPIYALEL